MGRSSTHGPLDNIRQRPGRGQTRIESRVVDGDFEPERLGFAHEEIEQVRDLAADLPAYDWIGLGRDGGSRGEFMAVFYRRDRFEPLAFDHFWLSDTPQVIASTSWGNRLPRMVTWVRFRDRSTGRVFEFWNTHLDHQSEPARQQSAVLLRDRIAGIPADIPVVVTGDFNAVAGASAAYTTLTADGALTDIAVDELDVPVRAGSFDEWWDRTCAFAGPLTKILASVSAEAREAMRTHARNAARTYETAHGIALPGLALLASGRRL